MKRTYSIIFTIFLLTSCSENFKSSNDFRKEQKTYLKNVLDVFNRQSIINEISNPAKTKWHRQTQKRLYSAVSILSETKNVNSQELDEAHKKIQGLVEEVYAKIDSRIDFNRERVEAIINLEHPEIEELIFTTILLSFDLEEDLKITSSYIDDIKIYSKTISGNDGEYVQVLPVAVDVNQYLGLIYNSDTFYCSPDSMYIPKSETHDSMEIGIIQRNVLGYPKLYKGKLEYKALTNNQ